MRNEVARGVGLSIGDADVEPTAQATISRTVKLRLLRPLDPHTWDDVGPQLRALAYAAHRILNRSMTSLSVAAEHPELVPSSWKSRTGKISGYQMTARAIEAVNEERVKTRVCVWCAGAKTEPVGAPLDKKGKPVKRSKRQLERAPGEACSRCDGSGGTKIGACVDVPSAVHAGWARVAEQRHGNDRRDVLAGRRAVSSFRSPAPIAITSSGEVFGVRHDGKGYVLEAPIYPGGAVGRVAFALGVDGRGAHAQMRDLIGGAKVGDCKILAPKDGKKKWLVTISYSVTRGLAPAKSVPIITVRVSRHGVEVAVPGGRSRTLLGAETIRCHRAKFSARRSSRSKHQRDISPGARGHGRARALEHYHAVDDAEQRWVRSNCQEIAAKAIATATKLGASWVEVDEESVRGLLPPAALREALLWALKKSGFAEPAKDLTAEASANAEEGASE